MSKWHDDEFSFSFLQSSPMQQLQLAAPPTAPAVPPPQHAVCVPSSANAESEEEDEDEEDMSWLLSDSAASAPVVANMCASQYTLATCTSPHLPVSTSSAITTTSTTWTGIAENQTTGGPNLAHDTDMAKEIEQFYAELKSLNYQYPRMLGEIDKLAADHQTASSMEVKSMLDRTLERARTASKRFTQQEATLMKGYAHAVSVYTEEVGGIYRILNKKLRQEERQDVSQLTYAIYYALTLLPRNTATVWRGLPETQVPAFQEEKVGSVMLMKNFGSFSADFSTASKFAGEAGVILEVVTSFRGRDVMQFSAFPDEKEVLFPPRSAFRVLKKKLDQQRLVLQLEEVLIGHGDKVLLWVDDKPDGNQALIEEAEKNHVVFICAKTTKEALTFLDSSVGKQLMQQPFERFRIISDLDRTVTGDSKRAGLELFQEIRQRGYTEQLVLYNRWKGVVGEVSKRQLTNVNCLATCPDPRKEMQKLCTFS
eukprot:TRINITY_DN67502_c7_g3_i1.p1 TRINITY_DN67502_c7_g3~~TRINITY_DN67502_c7_g3_i1.p1  ORF type:complete len:507 (-),score=64.24 TRINITY_DN67502_c7_g3_i1:143-1588(-)